MKIHAFTFWKVIAVILVVAVVVYAPADPARKESKPERNYTGVVVFVDTNQQVFRIEQSPLSAKRFAYGDKCEVTMLYAMLKNGVGSSLDLRPGEKVTVSYQDSKGVHIADRVEQQLTQFSGTVKEINAESHQLTLHRRILDERMNIAPDCITVLGDNKTGTLDDIHSGDHVVVIYETPRGKPVAWKITKTDAGSLAR